MTQRELNRAVARATGETVETISSLGFGPLTPAPYEPEPQTVDWDDLDAQRVAIVPQRSRKRVPA